MLRSGQRSEHRAGKRQGPRCPIQLTSGEWLAGASIESWPSRLDIETGPVEFSYPALIEDEAGLLLAYTWNRRRIAVVRVSAEEIPRT